MKKLTVLLLLVFSSYLTGCASVPMAPVSDDMEAKKFNEPAQGLSGIYVYRNSNFGAALKKSLYLDGKLIGRSAPMTYFFKSVKPGVHSLSTQSEFSNNDLHLDTEEGKNYFIKQYIKMGLLVGGAGLELIPEDEGKKGVLECKLAK